MEKEQTGSEGKGTSQAKNVMKGTVIFGTVAGLYVVGLWGFCYALSPTKHIVNRLPWPSVKKAYATGIEKAKHAKFLHYVPEEYRASLTFSFGEMLALKIMLGPAALPFKIWLTYKILQMTNS
jgi:hypothetical protein